MKNSITIRDDILYVHYGKGAGPFLTTSYKIEMGADSRRYIDFQDELECELFIDENELDDIETHCWVGWDNTAICIEDILEIDEKD